jgi:hypothetical membrane protein
VGVGCFVLAWAACGAVQSSYSPVDGAISDLAAVDAPDRDWMTAGFLVFGIGVPIYARALRVALPGAAWLSATISGLATLGVAATPLGRSDAAHGAFAALGYVALAATPLVAASALRSAGATGWARWSVACGVGSAVLLGATTIDAGHGLTQRVGLLITDAWIVATAWTMVRRGELP